MQRNQRVATSHKRETARRMPRAAVLAGSLAVLATGAVVSAGTLSAPAPDKDLLAVDRTAAAGSVANKARELEPLSRDAVRAELEADKPVPVKKPSPVEKLLAADAVAKAIAGAQKKWTTAPLNLWNRPDAKAKQVGEIGEGDPILVTGRAFKERAEVVVDGKARWVTAGYFSDEKPPTLGGACTNGTSVAGGVSPNIVKVHQAVCANFPEISVYGTLRGGGGDHPRGRAVDIMVSGERGWQVAEFVRANYQALGVSYVIYAQRIWSVERGGEGWRGMSNRGSATANHFDHVHVSTY
jgi:hypothetical protein